MSPATQSAQDAMTAFWKLLAVDMPIGLLVIVALVVVCGHDLWRDNPGDEVTRGTSTSNAVAETPGVNRTLLRVENARWVRDR